MRQSLKKTLGQIDILLYEHLPEASLVLGKFLPGVNMYTLISTAKGQGID